MVLLLVGCGTDGASPTTIDVTAVSSCAGLADAGIDLLQDTIDALEALDDDELAALDGQDEPEEFEIFEVRGDAHERRAGELGCSPEERARLLAERVDRLEATTVLGQLIIEGARAGGDL